MEDLNSPSLSLFTIFQQIIIIYHVNVFFVIKLFQNERGIKRSKNHRFPVFMKGTVNMLHGNRSPFTEEMACAINKYI